MLGMLFPRVLSGVVAEFTPWRTVYWIALGLQSVIFSLLWLFMPDYPAVKSEDLSYLRMLWGIISIVFKQLILVYACAIVFFSNGAFASYWTTLTALLSSPPYDFSSLQIGLFALIGIAPLLLVPPYSRLIIDRYVPTFCVVLGLLCAIIGVVIGTLTATLTIAGIILQALALDFGVQTASIAYRAAIYATIPSARNRVNVAYTVCAFAGQLSGTSIGNQLYAKGGWLRSGGFNIGLLGAGLLIA